MNAGTMTVMASFSSWQGVKMHGNRSLLTGVLKERMGFQGFVISDWNAHGQVPGCTTENCPASINAGIDMVMAADSWKGLYRNTLAQVRSGVIPMARVDDAVRRVLRVKAKLGLFGPRPLEGRLELIGAPEHRSIARQAVRESLVLLKNNGHLLPIRGPARVLVAGDGAENLPKQAGGWTLSWQGTGNDPSMFPGATSIYAGIREAVTAAGGAAELSPDGRFSRKPDVAIAVFGEDPYAEFQGDRPNLEFQPGDKRALALLRRLKGQGVPVVSVFLSGRPMWVNPELNASDAFVAAWLPGSEGAGIADVLVGDAHGRPRHDLRGKLSYSWPRTAAQTPLNYDDRPYRPLFAYGYGLSYASKVRLPKLSEVSGVSGVAANTDNYFVEGRFAPPWRMVLRDAGGETAAAHDPVASPRRILSFSPTDANGVQEAGRALAWSGAGEATAAIIGPAVDLSRQATGDMALQVRFRVDAAPSAPVRLGVGEASVGFAPLLQQGGVGQWRTVKVKLSCFRAAGANINNVSTALAITTAGRLGLTIAEARLASNQNDSICPGG